MSNEIIASDNLLAKFRSIRKESGAVADARTNTKQPIYDRIEQQKLCGHIAKNCAKWVEVFYRLSIATGWRTTDVSEIQYTDIDFTAGTCSIVVNKQTRAAEARAFSKSLESVRATRKRAALVSGDSGAYMRWDAATRDELIATLTTDEQDAAARAVAAAPVKRDTKHLPRSLLTTLADMRKHNHHDDYVFSRSQTPSNRARNMTGCVTRQSVWAQFKGVFEWFALEVNRALKLSAYSLRKCFAFNMLRGTTGKENNIAETMQLFGHSSVAMTMKYLGLASQAEQLQLSMVELAA